MTVLDDTAGDLKRENAELQRRLAERDSDVAELQRRLAEREAELAEAQGRLAERDSEFAEAIAQQAASSEVLQVINSSSGDLAPVFDAILEKALRLCEADFGTLFIRDGDQFRGVATRNLPPALAVFVQAPFEPSATGFFKRAAKGQDVAHIPDLSIATAHISGDPRGRALVELGGARTLLAAALRNNDTVLGAFSIYRTEVRPFADEQIALLKNFAAQAVIAMENARLITETREALAQQTATAEVLGVINSSPGNLTPVFDAILDKGLYLCEAAFGTLWTFDGECFHAVALHRVPAGFAEVLTRAPYRPEPGSGHESLLRGASYFQLHDAGAELSVGPVRRALVELGGARTVIAVPLRKEGTILGAISAYRQEVRSFTDKQIALLQNFAAQAVIAMENARLITETREALEQQTATAEVLGVINASPGDLAPVFDAMVEKAMRLCDAANGVLRTFDGELFHLVSAYGDPDAVKRLRELGPIRPSTFFWAPIARGDPVVHIPDVRDTDDEAARERIGIFGIRTWMAVPLSKDGAVVGAIAVFRKEVRPFSDSQIALLQNFAAQAVIAMENARLITETREALEQQTATAEVLGVINASPGDLAPVFDAMLDKALRLCEAQIGNITTCDGEQFQFAATAGHREFAEWVREHGPFQPEPGTTMDRMLRGEDIIHIADIADDVPYRAGSSRWAAVEIGGFRTSVQVALRKDGRLLGQIAIYRQEVRPFTDKQIALLQNFAAQAVIAMENARLLGELRQRTDEVAELNRGLEARVAEQVEELGRVGRLKRFLAPQLAELIVSQGDEKILESHRREIVVVFCDLRGYTAFTETAEPEEVLDFLREYHGALGPLVSQFEGTLDQFSGDGIMVFFNDPVPVPDPAERAVKMSIAMRETANRLIATWRQRDRELGFGAGIAQGYATLGQIGFADRSGYTAIGTVCNLAARLCGEAKDGQILVAGRVAAAVRETTALEDIGPVVLKGLTQPVSVFNVKGLIAG